MTNYNDGQWHGWNGGECPVHPKSKIQAVLFDDTDPDHPFGLIADEMTVFAGDSSLKRCWGRAEEIRYIIAFRVVKEYTEPREFWITDPVGYEAVRIFAHKPGLDYCTEKVIKVREVTDD